MSITRQSRFGYNWYAPHAAAILSTPSVLGVSYAIDIGKPSDDVSSIFLPDTCRWGRTISGLVLTDDTIALSKDLSVTYCLNVSKSLKVVLSANSLLLKVAVLMRLLPMSTTRFNVQGSMFNVRSSGFNVRSSGFDVQRAKCQNYTITD